MENILDLIKTTKTEIGKSQMTSGNAYRVTIAYNGKKCGFIFNDNMYNKSNKKDFIYCLISDADAYCYGSFKEFCLEYGYNDDSIKALKIYKVCKKQYERLHRLFNDDEIKQLQELLADY